MKPIPLALAVGSLLHAASSASAQQTTLETAIRDTTLANGLQVVVVPNPTVPMVTIQVTVRTGAFTQLAGEDEGVPHLLEHMLFRGSDFGEEASKLDAYYNGTTGDETVTYYMGVPAEHLDRGVRALADLVRAPRFSREDLESEQKVVRGELELRSADPVYVLSDMVDRELWGEAYGRKNPIGNALTIAGATPARLKKMYETFYVPNNAAVIFSGDVEPAAAFASAARHFVRWQRAADPFEGLEIPPMPKLEQSTVTIVELEARELTLLIRWPGPSVRTDPGAALAADVFSAVINDPLSDFQTRLVDSGLFQSLSMSYQTAAHVGPISLHATTSVEHLAQALRSLREEVDRFSQEGYVMGELLDIAKKKLEVDWAMSMETPSGLAHVVGELWSVADLDYARAYIPGMQAQQPADLDAFVSTYLAGKPYVMGINMTPELRQQLGPSLAAALAPWR